MKKVLLLLVLLIIIGGTLFYFGWIQIRIPEHHYAVVFTKTSGYREDVLLPGKFYWSAEKLLPTNMTLHLFDGQPKNRTISIEKSYPSAERYASVLGDPADFSIRISLSLTYSVKPEFLPRLVEKEGVSPETWPDWMAVQEGRIAESVAELVMAEESPMESSRLLETLSGRFPHLTLRQLTVRESSTTDPALYETARELYLQRLRSEETMARDAEEAVRQWTIPRKEKLAVIEEYGRILSEYPGLLKLLIENGEGAAIDLPALNELLGDDL